MKKMRKKILIIGDDKKIALALQIRLKANGHSVWAAYDAIEGASLGRTVKPDLVLMDIAMPGGNGFQLAETFVHVLETRRIPIIFVTPSRNPDLVQKVWDLGAADLVEKPFDTERLIGVIERELKRFDTFDSETPAAAVGSKRRRKELTQILIIEDNEKIALALALRLKAAGYRAMTTYDALTGLKAAVTNPPALVLMDISMPAGNGFSVAERIQALIPTHIPIIFVTASKKAAFREKAKKMGAAGYFEKPYEMDDLFGAIRRALA